jgi:hypothetical protein
MIAHEGIMPLNYRSGPSMVMEPRLSPPVEDCGCVGAAAAARPMAAAKPMAPVSAAASNNVAARQKRGITAPKLTATTASALNKAD